MDQSRVINLDHGIIGIEGSPPEAGLPKFRLVHDVEHRALGDRTLEDFDLPQMTGRIHTADSIAIYKGMVQFGPDRSRIEARPQHDDGTQMREKRPPVGSLSRILFHARSAVSQPAGTARHGGHKPIATIAWTVLGSLGCLVYGLVTTTTDVELSTESRCRNR